MERSETGVYCSVLSRCRYSEVFQYGSHFFTNWFTVPAFFQCAKAVLTAVKRAWSSRFTAHARDSSFSGSQKPFSVVSFSETSQTIAGASYTKRSIRRLFRRPAASRTPSTVIMGPAFGKLARTYASPVVPLTTPTAPLHSRMLVNELYLEAVLYPHHGNLPDLEVGVGKTDPYLSRLRDAHSRHDDIDLPLHQCIDQFGEW